MPKIRRSARLSNNHYGYDGATSDFRNNSEEKSFNELKRRLIEINKKYLEKILDTFQKAFLHNKPQDDCASSASDSSSSSSKSSSTSSSASSSRSSSSSFDSSSSSSDNERTRPKRSIYQVAGNACINKNKIKTKPKEIPDPEPLMIAHSKEILNIMNKGSLRELKKLPLIGQKTAQRILLHRELEGGFNHIKDLNKALRWGARQYEKFEASNFLKKE